MPRPTINPAAMITAAALATPLAGSGLLMLLNAAYVFLAGVMSDDNSDIGVAVGMLSVCVQSVAGCLLVMLGLGLIASVVADGWFRTLASDDIEEY